MFRRICYIYDFICIRYLISLFLQKEAGIKNLLRVVPLFETLEDLINAKRVMQKFFLFNWYRKMIKKNKKL